MKPTVLHNAHASLWQGSGRGC